MKPPFRSVVIIPENNSAPDPLVSTHVVVLAEMPPMTESSTLAHPVTDRGLANSNNTLVVGSGGGRGLDVTGGSSSVVTEVSVDGVERVSELQELRRNSFGILAAATSTTGNKESECRMHSYQGTFRRREMLQKVL